MSKICVIVLVVYRREIFFSVDIYNNACKSLFFISVGDI